VRAVLTAFFTFFVAGILILYVETPSAGDLDQRVAAIAGAAGQPVLAQETIPDVMRHAIVAVEDERFYAHHGLDTIGFLRATLTDATHLCACEGGSTLTQQLANVVYYERTNHIVRKMPSMLVALRIESRSSKERILEDYLTVVPSGRGLVGARQAACVFFGHDLSSLTLGEAAEIAGMPQAPSNYDPRYNPALARHRRDVVLMKMVQLGYVADAQAQAAMAEPVLSHGPGC
jgi:penicillin-binding protein 1A